MTASQTIVKPQKSIPDSIPEPVFGLAADRRRKAALKNRTASNPGVERRSSLLEFLPYHPYKLLNVVFETPSHHETLIQQLSRWLDVYTLNATQSGFYEALPLLIDALNRINEQKQRLPSPFHFLRDFFQRYPQDYVRRELSCCVHVVLNHAYDNRDILPATVLDWYEQVYGLVEAASILSLPRCINHIAPD